MEETLTLKPTPRKKVFGDVRLAALYTLLVFVSLYFAPMLRDFLAHHRLLAGAVSAVYVVLGSLGVILIFHKYRIRKAAPYLLFSGLFLVFLSVFYTVELLIERLHLLEYALMFAFWFRALRHFAASAILCHGATLLACALLGAADEAVQYLLPNRYFDLQDIFLNVMGSAFGMGTVVIFFRYRGMKTLERPSVSNQLKSCNDYLRGRN